jgi:hypothetical protein
MADELPPSGLYHKSRRRYARTQACLYAAGSAIDVLGCSRAIVLGLLCLFGLLGLLEIALPAAAREPARPLPGYERIKKPENILALLRNIKTAVNDELLLKEDFYTEINLSKFLGGTKFGKYPQNSGPHQPQFSIWGFGDICPPQGRGAAGDLIEGVEISIVRDLQNRASAWAELRISLGEECGPTLKKLEPIFGTQWKSEEQHVLFEPGYQFPAPTAPHGNELITYHYYVRYTEIDQNFTLRYNGRVDEVRFSLHRHM